MVCINDPLIQKISQLYDRISNLQNLSPSDDVNAVMTELVHTCIPPHPIDVSNLCSHIQHMRSHLISLSGEAESLLETHYSAMLASLHRPLDNLHLFPYYSNYVNLSRLEFNLFRHHTADPPSRLAFIGSGPLPLSSIVLSTRHLPSTAVDNFDINPSANALAAKLVAPHPDVAARMSFRTTDVMNVPGEVLREYDVVFLAALVGIDMDVKVTVIDHLAKNMAEGAILVVRSAHGARGFLYPVVETRHLQGFDVLSVYHPTDEVINSIIVARRRPDVGQMKTTTVEAAVSVSSCKCSGMKVSRHIMEDLGMDKHLCL